VIAEAPEAKMTRRQSWQPLEALAPFAAVFLLVLLLLPDYRRTPEWVISGTDFRVVLTAARALCHGNDPYVLEQMPRQYVSLGLPVPPTLSGRAPVYPPMTLVLVSPLLLLGGVRAVWAWMLLSALGLAAALGVLMRWSGRQLGLTLPWRMGIAALTVALPMTSFALELANVSVLAVAAATVAWCWLESKPASSRVLLAIALLLKPHLGVVVVVAMAVTRGRLGRRVAVWSLGAAAAVSAVVLGILAVQGRLGVDASSFLALLRSEEAAGGSMSPGFLHGLPVALQVTPLSHLLALLPWPGMLKAALLLVVLAASLATLLWAAARLRGQSARASDGLVFLGALTAFAMVASYHRAQDALLLLPVMPWLFSRIRQQTIGWAEIGLIVGTLLLTVDWISHAMPPGVPAGQGLWLRILYFRMANLACLLLLGSLLAALVQAIRTVTAQRFPSAEPPRIVRVVEKV
jgi:hypothetical protein